MLIRVVDAAGWPARLSVVAIALIGPTNLSADESADVELGRTLFTTAVPACAVCHTLQAAEATGEVGPILDELKPDAARVEKALRDGIGNMPSYRSTLSDEQIRAIARYVATATAQ